MKFDKSKIYYLKKRMKIERYAREAKDWMEPDILRTQEFIYFVCKTSKFSPHSFKGTEA